jgi:hypothetical protein
MQRSNQDKEEQWCLFIGERQKLKEKQKKHRTDDAIFLAMRAPRSLLSLTLFAFFDPPYPLFSIFIINSCVRVFYFVCVCVVLFYHHTTAFYMQPSHFCEKKKCYDPPSSSA